MGGSLQSLLEGLRLGLRAVRPGSAAARQVARRRLALKVRARLQREMTFRRSGFAWTGPTSCSITRAIYVSGHHQDAHWEPLHAWLSAHTDFARPVIVNVGANIGDAALPLSRTGKRIIAIEPNPETFLRLQRNVRQNGLDGRIICCEVAIATRTGQAELVVAADPGNSELNEVNGGLGLDGVDERRQVVPVRTAPLGELLRTLSIQPDDVALVWSDTQGFEAQVIASAPELWASGTPLWVEVWPKGLACHGGIRQFTELCRRHFRRVLSVQRLADEPEPIAALDAIVDGLAGAEFTDVLLIP